MLRAYENWFENIAATSRVYEGLRKLTRGVERPPREQNERVYKLNKSHLRAHEIIAEIIIFLNVRSNYAWLMLAAVRALVEQQPAEEDYSKFR